MSEWPKTGAQSQGGPYTHAEGTPYTYDSPRAKGTVKVTNTHTFTHYIAVNLGTANEVGRTPQQVGPLHCGQHLTLSTGR